MEKPSAAQPTPVAGEEAVAGRAHQSGADRALGPGVGAAGVARLVAAFRDSLAERSLSTTRSGVASVSKGAYWRTRGGTAGRDSTAPGRRVSSSARRSKGARSRKDEEPRLDTEIDLRAASRGRTDAQRVRQHSVRREAEVVAAAAAAAVWDPSRTT